VDGVYELGFSHFVLTFSLIMNKIP